MAFPVSEEMIAAAETVLGRRLPIALRARLRINNGGEVSTENDDWNLFPVRDTTDRKRLFRTANDIVRESEVVRKWSGFPPAAIAVASNGEGDLLIVEPGSETILVWRHEAGLVSPIRIKWD